MLLCPLVTRKEKNSLDILLNFSFCAPRKKNSHTDLEQPNVYLGWLLHHGLGCALKNCKCKYLIVLILLCKNNANHRWDGLLCCLLSNLPYSIHLWVSGVSWPRLWCGFSWRESFLLGNKDDHYKHTLNSPASSFSNSSALFTGFERHIRETFGNVPSCFMTILSDVGRPQAWNLPKQRLWPIKQYQEMNTNETLKFYDSYPAELKPYTVVHFCWL